jgi:hypothetical protein
MDDFFLLMEKESGKSIRCISEKNGEVRIFFSGETPNEAYDDYLAIGGKLSMDEITFVKRSKETDDRWEREFRRFCAEVLHDSVNAVRYATDQLEANYYDEGYLSYRHTINGWLCKKGFAETLEITEIVYNAGEQ